MKNDFWPLMLGSALFLAIALLVSSCRTDKAPPVDIGIGDGFGGANATLSTGEHVYWKPSELENAFIIKDPKQSEALIKWCFNPLDETAK